MAWGRWGGPRLVMMNVANLHHIKQQKLNLKVGSRRTTTISAMGGAGGQTLPVLPKPKAPRKADVEPSCRRLLVLAIERVRLLGDPTRIDRAPLH